MTPIAPRTIVRSKDEMRRIRKKRIALVAGVVFCLFTLIDCLRMAHAGFRLSWDIVLLEAAVNIVWTVLFLAAWHLVWKFVHNRVKTG